MIEGSWVTPFSLEEVRMVVFGFDRNKAPCSDGFPVAFLQGNWDCIKDDLWNVFCEFYERGILDKSLNETFICLISKEERVRRVKDCPLVWLRS